MTPEANGLHRYETHNQTLHPEIHKDNEFLKQTWQFVNPGKHSTEVLDPGNYEWPFEYIIPGDSPETIDGSRYFWCHYRFKATIERGTFQSNVVDRDRIRVLRVFDSDALELAMGAVSLSLAARKP